MEFIALALLLVLSAVFSGTETALFSLDETDLARLQTGGRQGQQASRAAGGRRVAALLGRANDMLSALLIGNLLVNTAAGVVATSLCLRLFGDQGLVVAVPVVTLLLLLMGEITPKMLALRYRQGVAVRMSGPLGLWMWLTRPFLLLTGAITGALLRMVPGQGVGSRPLSPEELQTACDLAVEEGSLTETDGRSLSRLIRLEDLAVSRIMTPRTAVVLLRRDMSLKQVLATARRAHFNRYPVVEPDGDRPVGFFHLKDLLSGTPDPERPLAGPLRELLFVPESKDVAALLGEMRSGGAHLASVVDEHGDFAGIVTLADCLQAVLGPVMDGRRHDTEMVPLGGGRWVISGRTDLRKLAEECGVQLPESRDYVTVAGYMMARMGRVLQPGDHLETDQARYTVLEMSGLRVDRISLVVPEPEPEDEGAGREEA